MKIRSAFAQIYTAFILAVCVIWLYISSSLSVKIVLTLFALIVATMIWYVTSRKIKISVLSAEAEWQVIERLLDGLERRHTYILKLSPNSFRQPVYIKKDKIYIHIGNPEYLTSIATRLSEYHSKQTIALGVEISVYSTLLGNIGTYLKDCLRNLLFLQRNFNFTVPVGLVIHAPSNLFADQFLNERPFVLRHQGSQQEANIDKFLDDCQEVLAYSFLKPLFQTSVNPINYFRASQVVACVQEIFKTQADLGWSYVNIRSITLIADEDAHAHSLWSKFVSRITGGLKWPQSEKIDNLEVEIFASNHSDAVYRKNILLDFVLRMAIIFMVALGLAIFCSGVNNYMFLKGVNENLTAFQHEEEGSIRKKQAREKVEHDLANLKTYHIHGEPTQLGLGLYRGESVISQVEGALNQVEKTASKVVPKRVVLTLDSLALFESGQYQLKHNANKALISVLKAIESQPNTQILVEGHTDNVGGKVANQQLSEKRAMAVRDWLTISSNLPVTRFAVKGFGDTRPIADNQTEEGRAKNRRVEIILIPDEILPTK